MNTQLSQVFYLFSSLFRSSISSPERYRPRNLTTKQKMKYTTFPVFIFTYLIVSITTTQEKENN